MTDLSIRWKIIQDYFKLNDLSGLQIDSFNHFVNEMLPSIINNQSIHIHLNDQHELYVVFRNVYTSTPTLLNDNQTPRKLYPYEARDRDLTYETAVTCGVEIFLIDKTLNTIAQTMTMTNVELFKIPVMVFSCLCNLKTTFSSKMEETYNRGGFFIIKGKERVIVAQERINYNQVYVFKQKIKNCYVGEIRSIKEGADYSVLLQTKLWADKTFTVNIPYINHDIPVGILFRSLDVSTEFIKSNVDDDLFNLLYRSMRPYETMSVEDAVDYISQYTANKVDSNRRLAYTRQVLENELFPHLEIYTPTHIRVLFLCTMLNKTYKTSIDARPEDDRDHICNKRIEMVGELMGNLINSLFKRFMKSFTQQIDKKEYISRIEDLNILTIINRSKISRRLYYCFSTGNWGLPKSTYIRQGVSQALCRLSYIGTMSHLRRVVVPIGKKSRNTQVRQLHSTNYGFICPCETPEGQSVGIVKNFALMTSISRPIHTVDIINLMHVFSDFDLTHHMGQYQIYINGYWYGSILDEQINLFVTTFKRFRDMSLIPESVSIGYDDIDREINILSDGGRIMRPVLDIAKYTEATDLTESSNLWTCMLEKRIIVHVDGNEAESSIVYTEPPPFPVNGYCDIHPSLMMGICANTIPFPEHSQAPRNVYVSAMMKQAIGVYAYTYQSRFDTTANVLTYPQKRITRTNYIDYCHCDDMPSGQSVIVAVMCYGGYNQEDSVLLNQSAIDRGLFHVTLYRTTYTSESRKGTHECERINAPIPGMLNINYNYSKLDEHGIIKLNAQVYKNDVLVSKSFYIHDTPTMDCSLVCKSNEEGIIDRILVTTNAAGYKIVKIKIRQIKIPEIGDKFCQVSAQKGTCGMTYRQEDMPFTAEGIVPDLIVNPHALPSRMTINMLLEMLGSKVGCLNGHMIDASAFDHDGEKLVEQFGKQLYANGYDSFGTEMMYNGFTGEPFTAKIFIGPAYYQRLKHLVSNKIHARSYGNVQLLSQQPCAGRSREGGLRFGEMERDCVIVHGISAFLKERLFNLSDPYHLYVCRSCGVVVNTPTLCMLCKDDDIIKIGIPYACNLLFRQLEAMNIKVRIKSGQPQIAYSINGSSSNIR